MKRLILSSVSSTNSYVAARAAGMNQDVMVVAEEQTAGRGQRGNHWEAEPGKNLTCTMLWHPDNFPVKLQFAISRAVSLALIDTLSSLGIEASIKWPNDIYVDDRKIAGILIEHAVAPSKILHTIIGMGLNVNQTEFLSDAPNPVSIKNLINLEVPVTKVLEMYEHRLEHRLNEVQANPQANNKEYHDKLWRADGRSYPFADAASGRVFGAKIVQVGPMGTLHLQEPDGSTHQYAFKEVQFLII